MSYLAISIILVIRSIARWLIDAYITVLFIRMIVDWVMVLVPSFRPQGVISTLISLIYQLTEPPLRFLRKYIPPVPLGAISLDIAFIVLYFILAVLRIII